MERSKGMGHDAADPCRQARSEERMRSATLRNAEVSCRAEQGCINYDLHRSHEDPGLLIFYENWESRPLRETHMKSPHLVALSKKQGALTESRDLSVGGKV